jgi:hypothetical protein
VSSGLVTLKHVRGDQNVSDVLTKALPGPRFQQLSANLGITDTASSTTVSQLHMISDFTPLAPATSCLLDQIKPASLIPRVVSTSSWSGALWEAIRYSPEIKDFAKLCRELLHYEQAGVRHEDQEIKRQRRQAKKYWRGVLEQQLCPACLEQMPGWENSIEDQCDLIEAWRDGRHFHHNK